MKLDRMLGILTILLQTDSVTAPRLAERFEVSRRTINRDIDALCRAGIPVITRQGGGGGISIAEGFKLDKSVLTADELGKLIAALEGLDSVSSRPQIGQLLDKLGAGGDAVVSLREPVVIDLASHYHSSLSEKIERIKEAIAARCTLVFDYYYEKGESKREVEPHLAIFQWTSWYLFGYCLLRGDWRMFKLNRLWNLRLGERRFGQRDIPPEARDFGARFPENHRLVALFDPAVKYRLVDAYGPHCFTEHGDGRLRLELGYPNQGYILEWLLGFGGAVQVLEPPALADRLCREAEEILRRNRRT